MKKTLLRLSTIIGIVFIIFACTNKEINLITNVELDFEQSNTDNGFVKELLPTTLTITPEVFLPEFDYFFQYEILEGDGAYINTEGTLLPTAEPITLERKNEEDTNFVITMNYRANNSGTHRVKVTASDNFEKSFSQVLTYTIADIPVIWTASSPLSTAEETQEIPITLTFSQKEIDDSIEYQVEYTILKGSGQLLDSNKTPVSLGRYTDIDFGVQDFTFIANQLGDTTLRFQLLDSNGQTITETLTFSITEFVIDTEKPIITLIGASPLLIFTGSTYTDPGATATDNKDDDTILTQQIITDSSQVDTTTPGNYLVTYTVTDNSGNIGTTTRTVTVQFNLTDVPQFSVKGNTTDFTTTLELGSTYQKGSIDNLSDNGTITNEDCIDQSAINNTIPDVGNYTVTYLATDNDTNTTTITETVIVADTTKPTFTIKGNTSDFATPLQLGSSYTAGAFQDIIDLSTTDGGTIIDPQNITGTAPALGQYPITYTVKDAYNNTHSIVETVTVTDTSIPTFMVQGNTVDFVTTLELGEPYNLGVISDIKDNGTTDGGISEDPAAIGGTTPAIGSYTVTYTVTDNQNNTNRITETIEVVDTTPPSFSVKENTTDFTTNLEFGAPYTPGQIQDPIDLSGFTETILGTDKVDTATEGSYTVTYTLTDQSPNANTASIIETVNVAPDNQPPTAVIQANPGLTGIAPYTVTLDGSASTDPDDGDSIAEYLWILGNGNQNTNSSTTQTYDTAGNYDITLRVTDQNNAVHEKTVTIEVAANMPPTFSVRDNTADFTTQLNVGTTFVVGDINNIKDDKPISDRGTTSGATNLNNTSVCYSNNNAVIEYSVMDADGLTTTIAETLKITDTEPPSITITPSTVKIYRRQDYEEPEPLLRDNGPCSDATPTQKSGSIDTNTIGTYDITYTGTDAAGNQAAPTILTVDVVNRSPVAMDDNFSQTANTIKEYTILVNDSDPDGDSFSIESITQPSNGGTVAIADDRTIKFTSNNQTGTATFTYRIKDEFGDLSDFATVTMNIKPEPNTVPTAKVTASTLRGEAPITVTFDGSGSSDPDPGDSLSYSWSVNDNRTKTTSFLYTTPGTFDVTLTVTDSKGFSDEATVQITITDDICDGREPAGGCPPGQVFCFDICACKKVDPSNPNAVLCIQ